MKEGIYKTSFLDQELSVFYVTTKNLAIDVLNKLLKKDCLFGLDCETMPWAGNEGHSEAGLDPHLSTIRLLQICDGKNIVVFDIFELGESWKEDSKNFEYLRLIKKFISSKKFVAHNALFDLQFLLQKFSVQKVDIGCTYLMWKILAHAQTPNDTGFKGSLDVLVEKLLGVPLYKKLQTSDWTIEDLTWEQIEYSALDAIAVLKLAERIAPSIVKLGSVRYYKLLKAAQLPIARMQLNGITLNEQAHLELINLWREGVTEASNAIRKTTGLDKITPHSVAKYLEEHLPADLVAVWPRTEEGKLMCDAHTLLDYYDAHPLINLFAMFQKKEKLTTSFGINLRRYINPVTGRLHAKYKLCGARTGRLACNNPNLQQLPRDWAVRNLFVAAPKRVLLCADYSQIEIRVGAELSRDEAMLQAYRNGVDLHSLTAAITGKKSLSKVTKEDRQKAKAFNFGLMFGLGPRKFSRYAKHSYGVDVSNEEAKASIKIWRDTYKGYHEWQLKQTEIGASKGRVRTPCGKVRMLEPGNSYGASMNTPVQGGACECILACLIRLQDTLDREKSRAKICNCVHDEIVVECPLDEVPRVKNYIQEAMEDGFRYVFPEGIINNICEVGVGETWAKAKS